MKGKKKQYACDILDPYDRLFFFPSTSTAATITKEICAPYPKKNWDPAIYSLT